MYTGGMDGLAAGSTCGIEAPGKINLFLEVLSRRDDGFHEIETLMTAVSIHDTLYFEATREGPIRLTCTWASGMEANCVSHGNDVVSALGDLPPARENLVYQSVEKLRRVAGVVSGAKVRIQKRIPAAAGLGGASSDAAAALLAANHVWRLGWSWQRLADLAAELGSDIPFFLSPASRTAAMAIGRGRGERLEFVPSAGILHCVVVRPPEGLSTAAVYRNCRPAESPVPLADLQNAVRRGQWAQLGRGLFNRLETAASKLNPRITNLRNQFRRLDFVGHGMSGSGSSFFGVCRHRRHARRAAAALRAARVGLVFTVTTRPTRCRFAWPA